VQINNQAPISNLLGNILELKNDIYEMQDYLDPTSNAGERPLGVMGQIMAQQLYAESNVLAFHAEQLTAKKHNEWELARHSSVLKNKVALLVTFAGILSQLAVPDARIKATTAKLSRRIIARCQQVEEAIAAVISTAVVSHKKLQHV